MQGISIFKQTYAAGASRVVMGFDSAINTYSPYAIGCIVGKSYAMAAAVVNEDSDQWHIVNLNTKHGFDAVAVLGAIDEDAAASIAMRDFGRFKESAMWDSVIATNTGGLKRYIDSPLCVKGRKVFTGEIGAMQDMAAGQKILWDGIYLQSHQGSIRVLLSDMVQHDDESALVEKFDGLNAWLAESDVEVMEFDALVVENYRLEQTMAKLASAMGAASGQGGVSVTNVTQTKAVKLRNSGAIQVGVSFELSDGQAVTAIFNHADSETQKLGLKDTLFSWKWKLNSRDISAAVQPNNFENVKLDILAGRIMKLVNANSARFQRSQAKKLENEQALADGNARIAEKKATLESLKSEIESLHIQADEKAKADQAAIETKVEDQPQEPGQHYSEKIIGDGDGEPIVLTGKELGDFPDTAEGKKQLRAAAKAAFEKLLGDWVDCPALNGAEGDNAKVEIRKRGIKELMAFSGDPRKLKLVAAIADIIKTAKLPSDGWQDNGKLDKKPMVQGYYHLTNNINIDGESFDVRVIVEKDEKGLLHYDVVVPKNVKGFDDVGKKILGAAIPDNYSGVTPSNNITSQDENLVNEFDAAGEKYVLNLFIQVKDEHGNWVDLDDEDDFKAESEAAADDLSMETKISKQDDGDDMSIEELTRLESEAMQAANQAGIDYLNSIIDGLTAVNDIDVSRVYDIGNDIGEEHPLYLQAKAIIDANFNVEKAVAPSSYDQDIDYLNSVIGGRVDLSDKSITGEVRRIITSNSDNQEIQDLGLQAAKVLAEAKKQLAQTKLAEVQ